MNFERSRPVEILVVEDNAGDVGLVTEAFASSRIKNRITAVADGEQALEYLHGRGNYAGVARPDLILLDLAMPGISGHEVLAEIKSDAKLRRIPVIVWTNSKTSEDIGHAYDLKVNSYITKPADHDQLMEMVRGIEEFWMTVVRLPRE